MCCIEAILHLVRPDVTMMFTLKTLESFQIWHVSYVNKVHETAWGTARIRRVWEFDIRCVCVFLSQLLSVRGMVNVCSKRSNPPLSLNPVVPPNLNMILLAMDFVLLWLSSIYWTKSLSTSKRLVGRTSAYDCPGGDVLRPLHPSAHQTREHGHHHLGFHLHEIVGQGVNASADLPGHGHGIPAKRSERAGNALHHQLKLQHIHKTFTDEILLTGMKRVILLCVVQFVSIRKSSSLHQIVVNTAGLNGINEIQHRQTGADLFILNTTTLHLLHTIQQQQQQQQRDCH